MSSAGRAFRQIMELRMRLIDNCTSTARYDLCIYARCLTADSQVLIIRGKLARRAVVEPFHQITSMRCTRGQKKRLTMGGSGRGERLAGMVCNIGGGYIRASTIRQRLTT